MPKCQCSKECKKPARGLYCKEHAIHCPRCQCDPTCTNPPLPNSPFCKKHQKKCTRKAPLSGYETPFDDTFNKYPGIKESHNCFMYAFDHIDMPKKGKCTLQSCPIPFAQPGRASGYPKWSKVEGKRCPDLIARLYGDIPGIKMTTFTKKCPKGTRKIAAVIDPKEDYHFYRQDKDGMWSHKPGSTSAARLDSMGRPIYDPQLASRYNKDSGLNYKQFCGYLCAPTRKHRFKRGGRFFKKGLFKKKSAKRKHTF
jgi:hypothetical protein